MLGTKGRSRGNFATNLSWTLRPASLMRSDTGRNRDPTPLTAAPPVAGQVSAVPLSSEAASGRLPVFDPATLDRLSAHCAHGVQPAHRIGAGSAPSRRSAPRCRKLARSATAVYARGSTIAAAGRARLQFRSTSEIPRSRIDSEVPFAPAREDRVRMNRSSKGESDSF